MDYVIIKDASINSSLDNGDMNIQIKNQIIELLGYNLNINSVIIYLILMGILILSVKVITDSNLSLDYIKNWPGGLIIFKFLNKLLTVWSITNIYWLYFIIFSLLIMMIGSTYGMYGFLVLMTRI